MTIHISAGIELAAHFIYPHDRIGRGAVRHAASHSDRQPFRHQSTSVLELLSSVEFRHRGLPRKLIDEPRLITTPESRMLP